MKASKVLSEKFDEFEGYVWRRKGIITKVLQEEGLDLLVQQERNKKTYTMWNYSEPGFYLFAALLNYHRQFNGGMPLLEDIKHVLGEYSEHISDGYSPELVEFDDLISCKFPEIVDNHVILDDTNYLPIVGSYMGGNEFVGLREAEILVIADHVRKGGDIEVTYPDGIHKIMCERSVMLQPGDVLRVLKGIYYYSQNKNFLDNLYQNAVLK